MVQISFRELNAELSEEELRDLDNAETLGVVYDEDSPEMTPEMLKQFKV